jgi:RNA polymerase sigma factor (sigma-70 family)
MIDPALRGLVEAEEESETDRHLESALSRVTPLVRAIAARKLRSYGRFRDEDVEDVVSESVLVLVRRLRELKADAATGPIESLDNYAAAVAHSVCAQHHRRLHPERTRLKNRLRYVLGRDPRFALWDVPGEGLHCGWSRWRPMAADASMRERLSALARDPERWPASWAPPRAVDRADPAPLAAEVFERVGGPIELDAFVNLVAAVWQIDRLGPREIQGPMAAAAADQTSPEESLDRMRFARRLWAEILGLPPRQRAALLLNLKDARGAGMLWVFVAVGVASIRAIAAALELSLEELASFWGRLPIDDRAIAERLGCDRQQVINLRMSARKRLKNRLRAPDGSKNRANLGPISASQAGEP